MAEFKVVASLTVAEFYSNDKMASLVQILSGDCMGSDGELGMLLYLFTRPLTSLPTLILLLQKQHVTVKNGSFQKAVQSTY